MNNLLNFKINYFVYKTCLPTWKLDNNIFNQYEIIFILQGKAHYIMDGVNYHLRAGDLLFTHKGCAREATTTGMVCVAFNFDCGLNNFFLPTVSNFYYSKELEKIFREFEYEWLQDGKFKELNCGILFLKVLQYIFNKPQNSKLNIRVEKIKRYIVSHYNEKLLISDIAKSVGLNNIYCGALFKKVEGVTISEYISNIRIKKAIELLDEGIYCITEIAEICGFVDVYYFSNVFKKVLGFPPSKYIGKENFKGNL